MWPFWRKVNQQQPQHWKSLQWQSAAADWGFPTLVLNMVLVAHLRGDLAVWRSNYLKRHFKKKVWIWSQNLRINCRRWLRRSAEASEDLHLVNVGWKKWSWFVIKQKKRLKRLLLMAFKEEDLGLSLRDYLRKEGIVAEDENFWLIIKKKNDGKWLEIVKRYRI